MSEEICPLEGDNVLEHEAHRGGAAPKAKATKVVKGRFGLSACAVPGISLTNYSKNAQAKGWGAPCAGSMKTITISNGVRITVRTEIAELSRLLMEECLRRGYVIRKTDTGAYNCRKISGTNTWSNHAWALAIDINWQTNPYVSTLKTDMPKWMPALFNRYGFAWGGDYSGKKDAMHYEFMGTPAQAVAATALAVRELNGAAPAPAPAAVATDDVRWIQQRLNYHLGPVVVVDGVSGPATTAAVRRFQEVRGLAVDGEVGPVTRAALADVLPFPLPSGHFFGLMTDRNPDCHGGNEEWERAHIKTIQGALTAKGYNPGPVDGYFGRATFDAVAAWQGPNMPGTTYWGSVWNDDWRKLIS